MEQYMVELKKHGYRKTLNVWGKGPKQVRIRHSFIDMRYIDYRDMTTFAILWKRPSPKVFREKLIEFENYNK